jgi:hypothetical protein
MRDESSTAPYFATMNYTVHGKSSRLYDLMLIISIILLIAFMYSYYALRAMKWHIPRYFQIGLTICQILQMLIGCFINYKAFHFKQQGVNCQITYNNIYWLFAMYAIYFILFVNFFLQSYVLNKWSSISSLVNKTSVSKHGELVSIDFNLNSSRKSKKTQ